MSIDIEKQTLSTLKAWAKALKLKKVSTYDKAQMVDLMKSFPPQVLEKLQLQLEAEAAPAEKTPAGGTEQAPEKPEPVISVTSSEQVTENGSVIRESTSPEDYTEKTVSVSVVEEPSDEISGVPDEEKKHSSIRSKYNNISFSRNNRSVGRSGFGSYSESYRNRSEESGRPSESVLHVTSPLRPSDQALRPLTPPSNDMPRRPRPSYATGRVPEALRQAAPESRYFDRSSTESAAPAPEPVRPSAGGDSAETAVCGRLEILSEMGSFGFIRSENYSSGEADVYVSPAQIHRFRLKTGDVITGKSRPNASSDRNAALSQIEKINDEAPETLLARTPFEALTPVPPAEPLLAAGEDLPAGLLPLKKGGRVLVKAAPFSDKTGLLQKLARQAQAQNPRLTVFVLLIDARPEDVTLLKEALQPLGIQLHYSAFDEAPEHHRRVAEMVLGRAQRLVEQGRDVLILLDSLTRLVRAYNMLVNSSGRQLPCGLDPAAFNSPKRFFGAARCMREGGSLTLLATAHTDSGSPMDAAILDEFNGTANQEMTL